METFRPGQRVHQSGVYRVHHDSHRLMHEAGLRADEIFPSCKQWGRQVSFELLRALRDQDVLPFRSGEILEECQPLTKTQKQAG